jgi:predicted nucleotidyltransferase
VNQCRPVTAAKPEGCKLLRTTSKHEEERIMPDRLFTARAALVSLCRRHHIRRLSLFPSVLKGTERPDSDLDLLVEPGAVPGLLGLAATEAELSELRMR